MPEHSPRWEHFEHDADAGVRGIGATMAQAFEQAAVALTALVTAPERVAALHRVDLMCEAPDDELLLAAWLNRVVFAMATKRMLFRRYEVGIEGRRLRAAAWGEPVDRVRHEPAVEPKGATLTELAVRREPDGAWIAQCVVDV